VVLVADNEVAWNFEASEVFQKASEAEEAVFAEIGWDALAKERIEIQLAAESDEPLRNELYFEEIFLLEYFGS
jgi:hypothetical protein